MLSAETQDFNIPTSAFTFVLERPVAPVRKTFSPAPASPNNLSHRRNRSRGRSLDGRTKKTNPRLSPSSSPPATKKSQQEHSLRLDHDQEGPKAQDVELNVESNMFPGGIVTNAMKVIDDCRALGIQDVKLPHLVLAGERSSGKSSLLENLIGVPVPITTGQEARFPIEFKMVKDIYRSEINLRIIPSGIFTNLDSKKLQDFNGKKGLTRPMTEIEYMELLRDVSEAAWMKYHFISESRHPGFTADKHLKVSVILDVPPPIFACDPPQDIKLGMKSTVSRHCLQIEIRGPNLTPLSIIDTPGLHHSNTSYNKLTIENSDDLQEIGMAMETQILVEELSKDKRNIIIGVMAASQEATRPRIFQIAERFDAPGERTLGVLTKCDCVSDGESDIFQSLLKTAQNAKIPLKHGWYVVENRSSSEKMKGTCLEEAGRRKSMLFSGIPWHPFTSHPEKERMGIDALRKGLSNLYLDQIQTEVPGLIQKIRDQLAVKNAELQKVKEHSSSSQRSYLRSIVNEYKSRADEYSSDESIKRSKTDGEHLTVQLENCTQTLSDDLISKGASRAFHSATEWGDFSSAIAAGSRCAGDLADESNIYTWINERYQTTTGDKIPGCIPQSFIIELFNEQMSPWESVTENFIAAVSQAFRKAISECLQLLHNKDKVLQDKCEQLALKALEAKMDELRQECLTRSKFQPSQLLQNEVDNRVFDKKVREARLKRLKSVVAWMTNPSGLSETEKLEEYLNCDQHIVFQVHDILKALYNIAVRDYTSWIKMSFLGLNFIKETMDVCNNEFFDALSNEEIRAIFKPDLETEKPMLDLKNAIGKHERLLGDMEALMKDHKSASLKELHI